jgi:hypothetical protein
LVRGAVVILAYDAVLALGSRQFGYSYGEWWPGILGSLAIFAASGFLAGRDAGSGRGAGTAAGVALVDVLLGWPLSGAIVPGYFPNGTAVEVASTVAGVAVLGVAVGATIGVVAGWLGWRSRDTRPIATG